MDSKKCIKYLKITVGILGCIIVLGGVPFIVAVMMSFRLICTDTSNEWIGFWGGYLGALISSIATIGGVYLTLLDDRKRRQKDEIKRDEEAKERRRQEILPYLKSSFFIPKSEEVFNGSEICFVDFSNQKVKITDYITKRFKEQIDKHKEELYVFSYVIKNIGTGSAGNLLVVANETKIIRNGGMAPNDRVIISFLFKTEDIISDGINIEFYFSDIANIGNYYQNESFSFFYENQEVCMKKNKLLTAPESVSLENGPLQNR